MKSFWSVLVTSRCHWTLTRRWPLESFGKFLAAVNGTVVSYCKLSSRREYFTRDFIFWPLYLPITGRIEENTTCAPEFLAFFLGLWILFWFISDFLLWHHLCRCERAFIWKKKCKIILRNTSLSHVISYISVVLSKLKNTYLAFMLLFSLMTREFTSQFSVILLIFNYLHNFVNWSTKGKRWSSMLLIQNPVPHFCFVS